MRAHYKFNRTYRLAKTNATLLESNSHFFICTASARVIHAYDFRDIIVRTVNLLCDCALKMYIIYALKYALFFKSMKIFGCIKHEFAI